MMLPGSSMATALAPVASDESESLQADVMRFMAILGLCLMVIFALVQSLPSAGVSREQMRDQSAERSALEAEIIELRTQTSRLGQEAVNEAEQRQALQAITGNQRQEIERLAALIALREQKIEQLNNSQERQRAELSQSFEAQEIKLDQQRRQLESLQQTVQQERQELQSQIEQEQTRLRADKQELNQQQRALNEERRAASEEAKELEQLRQSLEDCTRSANVKVCIDNIGVEDKRDTEGFRLRFASHEAFFRLVGTKKIEVFVTNGETGYRLSANGKRLEDARLPTRFQQVNAESLPQSVVDVLATQGISQRQASWRVVLSANTLASIDRAREGVSSGVLVIEDTGNVRLEP